MPALVGEVLITGPPGKSQKNVSLIICLKYNKIHFSYRRRKTHVSEQRYIHRNHILKIFPILNPDHDEVSENNDKREALLKPWLDSPPTLIHPVQCYKINFQLTL